MKVQISLRKADGTYFEKGTRGRKLITGARTPEHAHQLAADFVKGKAYRAEMFPNAYASKPNRIDYRAISICAKPSEPQVEAA